MEKFLRKVADSQAFKPEDKLTKIIDEYSKDELDEESLDFVFAAGKMDYQEFINQIKERRKL